MMFNTWFYIYYPTITGAWKDQKGTQVSKTFGSDYIYQMKLNIKVCNAALKDMICFNWIMYKVAIQKHKHFLFALPWYTLLTRVYT